MPKLEEQVAIVKKLIHPMEVPAYRRDVSRRTNVRWLIRNLGIHNNKRASFKETIKELVRLQAAFERWGAAALREEK